VQIQAPGIDVAGLQPHEVQNLGLLSVSSSYQKPNQQKAALNSSALGKLLALYLS